MSETFDDMFGSDDEQTLQQQSMTDQTATTVPTMGYLFANDDEMTTLSITPKFELNIPPEHQLQNLKSTKVKAYGDGALGEPDHFYVQETCHHGDHDKNIILLTVPRIVGASIDPYDPIKFDRTAALSKLPPYQREYTQGVESMIRFKEIVQEDGTVKKISNSRIIKWDNGDFHLQVGRQYFPLTTKQQRIDVTQSADHLFFLSNGLYYHVGSIISSWKTSIAPHHLTDYRERMSAVESRLAELNKLRRNIQDATPIAASASIIRK